MTGNHQNPTTISNHLLDSTITPSEKQFDGDDPRKFMSEERGIGSKHQAHLYTQQCNTLKPERPVIDLYIHIYIYTFVEQFVNDGKFKSEYFADYDIPD